MMTKCSIEEVLAKTPTYMKTIDDELLNHSECDWELPSEEFAAVHNLMVSGPQCWTVRAMKEMVERGPLMIDMQWDAQAYSSGITL